MNHLFSLEPTRRHLTQVDALARVLLCAVLRVALSSLDVAVAAGEVRDVDGLATLLAPSILHSGMTHVDGTTGLVLSSAELRAKLQANQSL